MVPRGENCSRPRRGRAASTPAPRRVGSGPDPRGIAASEGRPAATTQGLRDRLLDVSPLPGRKSGRDRAGSRCRSAIGGVVSSRLQRIAALKFRRMTPMRDADRERMGWCAVTRNRKDLNCSESSPASKSSRSRALARTWAPGVDPGRVIQFLEPIAGFPTCLRYALLPYMQASGREDPAIRWLQAMDPPFHTFIVADPWSVWPDYEPEIADSDAEQLDALVVHTDVALRDHDRVTTEPRALDQPPGAACGQRPGEDGEAGGAPERGVHHQPPRLRASLTHTAVGG